MSDITKVEICSIVGCGAGQLIVAASRRVDERGLQSAINRGKRASEGRGDYVIRVFEKGAKSPRYWTPNGVSDKPYEWGGMGAPKRMADGMKLSIYLPADLVEKAKRLGGTVSAGVRIALQRSGGAS